MKRLIIGLVAGSVITLAVPAFPQTQTCKTHVKPNGQQVVDCTVGEVRLPKHPHLRGKIARLQTRAAHARQQRRLLRQQDRAIQRQVTELFEVCTAE